MDSLLLDVAHEPVAGLGADEVREEERVEHHALAEEHHEAENGARLLQPQECQQVHPLVLRLLQQGVYPTVIPVRSRLFQPFVCVGSCVSGHP